jgi:hypothetical protein
LATSRSVSNRSIGDYISLQSGLAICPNADHWRGYREEPSHHSVVNRGAPFYFCRKSLTPESACRTDVHWPVGFAAAAIHIGDLAALACSQFRKTLDTFPA